MPNRQHMEQMTAGITSYFLSISKLQASTSAMPVPARSVLSPVGSAILGECGRLTFRMSADFMAVLSQVHLKWFGNCKRGDSHKSQKNKGNVHVRSSSSENTRLFYPHPCRAGPAKTNLKSVFFLAALPKNPLTSRHTS